MMDADAVFTVGNLSPVTEEVIDRHHPVIPEVITSLFHIRACSTGTGEVIQLIYTATEYLTRFTGLSINIRNTNQLDMTAFLVIQLTGTFSQDSADIDFRSIQRFSSCTFANDVQHVGRFLQLIFPIITFAHQEVDFG